MVKIAPTTTMIMIWSIAAMVFPGFSASQAKADPPGQRHSHEGLTWPPQPCDITNVVVRSNIEREQQGRALRKNLIDRLEAKAKTTPEVKLALGRQFTHSTLIDRQDKATGTETRHLVFFSRDRNATVEFKFDKDEKIQAVKSIPAQEYQPEITDEEIEEATALARSYFLRPGFARIGGLKAYSILAYKPQGVGFFDARVLYISFHKHDDAPPELSAWVDLTNQRILQTLGER